MNNYLENQKDQIRYGSQISSLVLTLCLLIIKLAQHPTLFGQTEEGQDLPLFIQVFLLGLVLLAFILTYYTNYYTISSIFGPEKLSLVNGLLLVPCGSGTFMEVREIRKLLLEKKEEEKENK